jgi:flagellar motility protein MotE (MotC chaperone)
MGVSGAGDTLTSLSQRYSGILGQQEAAQRDAATQRAAQFKSAQDSIRQRRYGAPTTSEQLYALSSALLSPRSQPGFVGTMSNLMPALMQTSQMRRGAEEQREAALQQLQQQYATAEEKARAEGLETQRKGLEPLISMYGTLAKPKPLQTVGMEVVNGKLVVVRTDPSTGDLIKDEIGDAPADMIPVPGVTAQGQPVFRSPRGITTATGEPVTQFDPKETKPEKPRAPSSTEMRQIIQTEDRLNGRLSALRAVQDALGLNQQAYEGSLAGGRAALGRLFSSDDPAYVATEQLEQLVKTGALADLKATFGGNPTEGERNALLELQANITKPRAVRERFLRRLLQEIQIATDNERKRLEDLKSGQYGQYQQPSAVPATAKGKPRVINWGN